MADNDKAPIEKAGELFADASEQALVTHSAVKAVVKAWELARGNVRKQLWTTLEDARESLRLAMVDEEAAFKKLTVAVGQGDLFEGPAPASRKPAAAKPSKVLKSATAKTRGAAAPAH